MKKDQMNIRIRPEDKKKLQAIADKRRRTVTSLLDEAIEKIIGEDMKNYVVATGTQKDPNEYIEYEGADLNEATRIAENEAYRNRNDKNFWVELREMANEYDYDTIDYPLFSAMTLEELEECVQASECRNTPGKACYYILINKGDTEVYIEKLADDYEEEEAWEKQDEIEDDLIKMAKEKIEEMRPTK